MAGYARKLMTATVAGAALIAAAGMAQAGDLADVPGVGNPRAGTQWLIRGRIIGMVPGAGIGYRF